MILVMAEDVDQFNREQAQVDRELYSQIKGIPYAGQIPTKGTLISWLSWVINGFDVDRIFELTANDEAPDFYDPRNDNVPFDQIRIRPDEPVKRVQDAAHRIIRRWTAMKREAA